MLNNKKTSNKEQKKALSQAKLFQVSRPYGYLISEVNETIFKYNNIVQKQKEMIFQLKNELSIAKEENAELEAEIRNLQLQLNFVQVDPVSAIQENAIKENFEKNVLGMEDKEDDDIDVGLELPKVKSNKQRAKINKKDMLDKAKESLKKDGKADNEEPDIDITEGIIDFSQFLN